MTKIWKWIKNWFANHVVHIAIIWLIIGSVLFIGYSISTWQEWDWQALDWQVLAGFATWVLAGGVGAAIWQIRETRKSTNAQLTIDFYWRARSGEIVEKLRSIYVLTPEDFKKLPEKTKKEIDFVLDWLETLGALVVNKTADKQLATEVFGGLPALRCWYKLSIYIKEEREKRGYYGDNCEAFTREALEYFDKKHIKVSFYEQRADGTIISQVNLVEKLKLDPLLRPRSLKEIKRERDC